jgi:hypothetical protein
VGIRALSLTKRAAVEENDPLPVEEKYEEARSGIAKWLDGARAFWSTRQAILKGEALWDYDDTRLTVAKYYRSWKFNATQTGIAGGVAA